MEKMARTVLPFKLAATNESMTAQSGLILFGECIQGAGFHRWLGREMPKPASGHAYTAYTAVQHVLPMVLMLTGGGRSLEDLRMVHGDSALRRLLNLDRLPSTDATGDWLRRMGNGEGLVGLDRVNQRVVERRLRKFSRKAHTLDIDATQIIAEKRSTEWTYKGERGYMPMVGHLAEAGVVIHDDFRAGNVAPASANLDFVKACESRLPKGHRLAAIRADSASYQADLFNYCEETGKTFAIGGRLDAPTLAAIAAIPDSAWTHHADCAVAETVHSMEATHKAFRLIVVRYRHQADLLEEAQPRCHVIASNRGGSASDVLIWYRSRGEHSENGIKELKIGFGMERMPCRLQALWPGKRQCRLLPARRYCAQPLCPVQTLGPRRRLAVASRRHGALATVSGAGPARPPCRRLGPEGGGHGCGRLCGHSEPRLHLHSRPRTRITGA